MSYNLPELKALPALANRRAVASSNGSPTQMVVSNKLRLAKHSESIKCVCSVTGIVVELLIPSIPDIIMDYRNPLAFYSNAVALLDQPRSYLESLDLQILAGIWIVCYRHYDLVNSGKQSSSILNAVLRTAPKATIIDSLELFLHINSRNSDKLPAFSLDYNAHKEFQSIAPAIQEYSRVIRQIIYPDAKISTKDELALLLEEKYQGSDNYLQRKNHKDRKKISYSERDYEEQFISNRREAKIILARLADSLVVPTALLMKLKPLFIGKNLVAMSADTRLKVVTKMKSFNNQDCDRLAAIIKDGHNPYDIFASVDDAFTDNEAALATVDAPTKKRSLAEILASRKLEQATTSEAAEPLQEPSIQTTEPAIALINTNSEDF